VTAPIGYLNGSSAAIRTNRITDAKNIAETTRTLEVNFARVGMSLVLSGNVLEMAFFL